MRRFLATHGYNISLTHLVDQIASPYPKKLYSARTTAVLDEWPTPTDYYYNIREGVFSNRKVFSIRDLGVSEMMPNSIGFPFLTKDMLHNFDVLCCCLQTGSYSLGAVCGQSSSSLGLQKAASLGQQQAQEVLTNACIAAYAETPCLVWPDQ